MCSVDGWPSKQYLAKFQIRIKCMCKMIRSKDPRQIFSCRNVYESLPIKQFDWEESQSLVEFVFEESKVSPKLYVFEGYLSPANPLLIPLTFFHFTELNNLHSVWVQCYSTQFFTLCSNFVQRKWFCARALCTVKFSHI